MTTTTDEPRPFAPQPWQEIEALLMRLERAVLVNPVEAPRILRTFAAEARRLRALSLRHLTEMREDGERSARRITSESTAYADSLRQSGLEALERRLDEADRFTASCREAAMVELRAATLASRNPVVAR